MGSVSIKRCSLVDHDLQFSIDAQLIPSLAGEIFRSLKLFLFLLEQPVIFSDDTTVKVVGANKSKSYMWLYDCGADSPTGKIVDSDIPNIVLFDYNSGRGGQVIVDYLDDYNGYMHADGCPGYHKT